MSSVAYATGAMMLILAGAGTDNYKYVLGLSVVVVALLVIVTFSYRQTIRAYPNGGGSYIVAHANLGVVAGLVAAGSLLTDYVLTVSVSVSAGIQAITSAFPDLQEKFGLTVPLIALAILLVMVINLRGVKDSGTLFASPTYIFIGSMLILIGVGLFESLTGQLHSVTGVAPLTGIATENMGVFLICKAFADGCSAMTGTEAVANGVPAFKPPEWKNAQQTMIIMATLLGVMFLGTSFLAVNIGAHPSGLGGIGETVLSQVGRTVFGGTGLPYYILQFATMGILILAANTSFADFPRLSSILARDGFFPRQFALRGERLAFNSGIVMLSLASIGLAVAFGGSTDRLIGLYAIGVFTSFTLSQAGMVRHWFTERGSGWRRSSLINGIGAVVTAIVVVVIAISKFDQGVWMIVIVVPILVLLMLFIKHEYAMEGVGLEVQPDLVFGPPHRRQRVVVAAQAMSRAVVQAVRVGQSMGEEVQIVHVTLDPIEGERFRERVERQLPGVRVVLVESPYRALVRPFVRYLEVSQAEDPDRVTIVLLPEHLPRHWWDRILYNQNVHRIRSALVGRRDFVVLDTPYRRGA
jgi:amino acid transporter